MDYYFSKTIKSSFGEAISKATEALKTEGFGIISDIDISQKLKEKLNVDYKQYRILGACNPSYAYKALQSEEKIGTMLPCNVTVIDKEDGKIEIAIIDPVASMLSVENEDLKPYALEISEKLKKVLANIN